MLGDEKTTPSFVRITMKLILIKFKSSYDVNISCCECVCLIVISWSFDVLNRTTNIAPQPFWHIQLDDHDVFRSISVAHFTLSFLSCYLSLSVFSHGDTRPASSKVCTISKYKHSLSRLMSYFQTQSTHTHTHIVFCCEWSYMNNCTSVGFSLLFLFLFYFKIFVK